MSTDESHSSWLAPPASRLKTKDVEKEHTDGQDRRVVLADTITGQDACAEPDRFLEVDELHVEIITFVFEKRWQQRKLRDDDFAATTSAKREGRIVSAIRGAGHAGHV